MWQAIKQTVLQILPEPARGSVRVSYQALKQGALGALPPPLRERLILALTDSRFKRLPDRIYLAQKIIPAVARRGGRILFVGCREYTREYPAMLEAFGAECWTLDVDPGVERWGSPGRHLICRIEDAADHLPLAFFDTILLNGLFGFGLDTVQARKAALAASSLLLKEGGWFILGWDRDKDADPHGLPALCRFSPAALAGVPGEKTFAKTDHVYSAYTLAAREVRAP